MGDKALTGQVLAEHEILMHLTNALRTVLDWQDRDYDLSRKLSSLRFAAQSFQRHLERLLSLEEQDNYLAAVGQPRPDLRGEVEKLHEEHHQMRRTLNEIVHRLDTLPPTDHAGYGSASEDLAALLRLVERHGNQETAILEKALL